MALKEESWARAKKLEGYGMLERTSEWDRLDRLQMRILVSTVINLGVSLKAENFLTSRRTVIFPRTPRHVFYLASDRGIGENCILKYVKVILYT